MELFTSKIKIFRKLKSQNGNPKKFLIFLEKRSFSLNIKKVLYSLKRKLFSYSQKRNLALFCPNSTNKRNPPWETFLYSWKRKTRKKILIFREETYIFSKKLYI